MFVGLEIRSFISLEHRLLFYKAYIKPHIAYCRAVWSTSSLNKKTKINRLQRRACKLILYNKYNGLQESLERLNIMSFDQIVFLNKAKINYV